MPKTKRSHRPPKPARPVPSSLASALSEAETFIHRKSWSKARERLESLNQRYPAHPEVLSALAHVYYETDNLRRYQWACERLLQITPDDPDLLLSLAGACIHNLHPAQACRAFQRFLQLWPDHERAGETARALADLEPLVNTALADLGFTGPDGLELLALHEQTQALLEQGEYAQARRAAQQLLRRRPDFTPALNNISLACYAEGQIDLAIAHARRVLSSQPDNYHALSNLTRYLCVSGRVSEAQEQAERLKAIRAQSPDVWVKKAEAFSYLGDDQGVLDAFDGAQAAGHLEPPLANSTLYHLAAVAAMRLGQEHQARQYWLRALELEPGLELAQRNLADLRQPVAERHAPWPFSLANWLPQQAVTDLLEIMGPALRRNDKEAATQAARRYLRRHKEMIGLAPLLLDHGDPETREFALRLALAAETPEMLAALRDFALGQRGPDHMRMEAASSASKGGLLPSGMTRMWMQGKWVKAMTLGIELHGEPVTHHQAQVQQWATEGYAALQRGDGHLAERLFRQALAVEPGAPDLMNNLAAAYSLQERSEAAEAMVRQIHQDHPDYLFARTSLAHLHTARGEFDQARAMLEPLFYRRRMHLSEFGALCQAQVELFLAEGDPDSARKWLEMWEQAYPDHPNIDQWRQQLRRPAPRRRAFGQPY